MYSYWKLSPSLLLNSSLPNRSYITVAKMCYFFKVVGWQWINVILKTWSMEASEIPWISIEIDLLNMHDYMTQRRPTARQPQSHWCPRNHNVKWNASNRSKQTGVMWGLKIAETTVTAERLIVMVIYWQLSSSRCMQNTLCTQPRSSPWVVSRNSVGNFRLLNVTCSTQKNEVVKEGTCRET